MRKMTRNDINAATESSQYPFFAYSAYVNPSEPMAPYPPRAYLSCNSAKKRNTRLATARGMFDSQGPKSRVRSGDGVSKCDLRILVTYASKSPQKITAAITIPVILARFKSGKSGQAKELIQSATPESAERKTRSQE